jgi:peptide/nickel transport system substrate-binding protein
MPARKLDRGTFLRYGAGAALGVVAADPVAYARAAVLRTAGASAIDPNAMVKYGSVFTFPQFDPTTAQSPGAQQAIYQMFEALTYVDAKGAIHPRMITALPKRVAARQWQVDLLPNLTYHDGSQVVAGDIAFTVERIKDPKTASLFGPSLMLVERVSTKGSGRAIFHLKEDYDYFPTTLVVAYVVPEKAFHRIGDKNFGNHPVGSGPFQFVSLSPTVGYQLKRFKAYAGKRTPARAAAWKTSYVPDDPSREALLRSDQLQIIESVPARDFDTFGGKNGIATATAFSTLQSNIEFEHSHPPFGDVRVRQAFIHAIDRDRITKLVFFGHAQSAYSLLPPNNPYYVSPKTRINYDPTRAKQLLAEAGYKNGVSFNMLVGNNPWLQQIGTLIASQLAAVGMHAKIQLIEVEAGYNLVLQHKYEAFVSHYQLGVSGDPVDNFYRFTLYGANRTALFSWNDAQAHKYDKLVDRAFLAPSFAERKHLYGEAQELLNKWLPGSVPIHQVQNLYAHQDRVTGYRPLPSDLIEFSKVTVSK